MKIKFEREDKKPSEEEKRLEDKKKELEGLEGVMGILLPMTVCILIEKVEDIEKELKKNKCKIRQIGRR